MSNNKFVRFHITKHDPNDRCKATVKDGQCPYLSHAGTQHCPMHGSHTTIAAENLEVQRNYRLKRWQQRVNEFANNDQVKSLKEEVGILRMMLEEMINKCTDTTDLMLYAHRISDLVMKIERVVVSCDKLENRMGLLLSKDAVLQLAGTYVNIINTHVEDATIIELISEEMIKATKFIENNLETEDYAHS